MSGKNKALIIIIVLFLILSGAGISIVWLGLIRFGTPSLSEATTAETIDKRSKQPKKSAEEFTGDEDKIYCTARVTGFSDTLLGATWYYGDTEVAELESTFGDLADGGTTRFKTSSGYVAFFIDQPSDGWPSGQYRVQLDLEGDRAARKSFYIGGRTEDEDETKEEFDTYEEPDGIFSIEYPADWSMASESSLEENVLVGFVGPATDGFAPKFVVLVSSQPMDIDALNAELEAQGVPPDERFRETTIGESRALLRTFEWDYQSEDGDPTKLESVQALVEGDGVVYGIHFHVAADEFSEYESTIERVMDSFRVGTGAVPPASPTPVPEEIPLDEPPST